MDSLTGTRLRTDECWNSIFASSSIRQPNIAWPRPSNHNSKLASRRRQHRDDAIGDPGPRRLPLGRRRGFATGGLQANSRATTRDSVSEQVQRYCEAVRPCPRCHRRRHLKDYRRQRFDTVFGRLAVRVPRFDGCRHCRERLIASPVSELLPERVSPELRKSTEVSCVRSRRSSQEIVL